MGDDDELGSLFVNPIILLPKADYVKLVIDARYPNSITDLTNYSWPLKPVQMIMTRFNGIYFTASDLSCAYHQVPLTPETQKLTSFVKGWKQYTYQVGIYGLCGLPQRFSRMMAIIFELLIKKKKAITYLDDSLLQSHTKAEMITIIHEYHQLLRKRGLKAALDKTNFFLRKVKFLGHVISEQGTQPVAKRVKDLQNLKSPESRRDVMKVLGCLGFYSCYIKDLHVDSQSFYELIKDTTLFKWNDQHEELFNEIKTRISEDTILPVPSTEYPFHLHVDSSNVGTGCILVQQFPEGKRKVSFNSRVFDNAEPKMSTLHRELCGIVSALQTYEHYINGSPSPIYLYCDPKPLLYLCGRKKTAISSIFQISSHHHQFSQPQDYLDTRFKSCLSPIFSAETWHYQRQINYSFNTKKSHTLYHSMIKTVTKSTTPSSTKKNKTHPTTTSTLSSANKATPERLSDSKTMETSITLKTTKKIMKS